MNPEIARIEYYDSRFYRLIFDKNEQLITKYLPSTTTKLGILSSPFLAQWRGDIGNREADARVFESQQRGNRIHKAWEVMCKGGVAVYSNWQNPINPKVLEDLKNRNSEVFVVGYQDEMLDVWKLQRLVEILKPKIIASELTVWDEEMNEAGTIDTVWEIKEGSYQLDGKKLINIPSGIYIVDLKSGKNIDKANYQTADYAVMWEKQFKKEVAGTMVIHTASLVRTGIPGLKLHVRDRKQMEADYAKYRAIAKVWEFENEGVQPKTFDFPAIIKLKEV